MVPNKDLKTLAYEVYPRSGGQSVCNVASIQFVSVLCALTLVIDQYQMRIIAVRHRPPRYVYQTSPHMTRYPGASISCTGSKQVLEVAKTLERG